MACGQPYGSSREAEVEQAIRVLMHQGISTAEMRRATLTWSSGGEGHIDVGKAALACLFWPLGASFAACSTSVYWQWPLRVILMHVVHFEVVASIPFFFALHSSAQELAALVVDCTLRGCMVMVASMIVLCLFSLNAFRAVETMGTPNAVLLIVLLVGLRHRHIRKEALHTFCNKALPITILTGWLTMALTTKVIVDDFLPRVAVRGG